MVWRPIGHITHGHFEKPIGPKTHWSDDPSVHKNIIGLMTIDPKMCHWSNGPLVRKSVNSPKTQLVQWPMVQKMAGSAISLNLFSRAVGMLIYSKIKFMWVDTFSDQSSHWTYLLFRTNGSSNQCAIKPMTHFFGLMGRRTNVFLEMWTDGFSDPRAIGSSDHRHGSSFCLGLPWSMLRESCRITDIWRNIRVDFNNMTFRHPGCLLQDWLGANVFVWLIAGTNDFHDQRPYYKFCRSAMYCP